MLALRPGRERPWVIAHRGASQARPENTLAAFALALEEGCDGIELDVQATRDGVPVVFHDDTLLRVCGFEGAVADYPWAELRRFDAGSWFGAAYAGEAIPPLQAVFDLCAGRTRLFLELKAGGAELARRVAAAAAAWPGEAYLLSFHDELLAAAHAAAPHLPRVRNMMVPALHPYEVLSCAVERLTGKFVAAAHAAGQPVLCFTCNTEKQARKALQCRADGVFTDRPAWFAAWSQAAS